MPRFLALAISSLIAKRCSSAMFASFLFNMTTPFPTDAMKVLK